VLEKYPTEVRLVIKHFPLSSHKHSREAAMAAMAAARQGKFWEFNQAVFENYSRLDEQKLEELAAGLGLDMARFRKDRADTEIAGLISRDVGEGGRYGVRGTPTIFINGKRLGSRSLEGFSQMIDVELARAKQ
jgi:protein-disulfide isomerase